VLADEVGGGKPHRVDVEIVFDSDAPLRAWHVAAHAFRANMPGVASNDGVALLSAADEVAVALVSGVKARVVAAEAGLGVVHDDVLGQARVEPTHPALARHLDLGGEARDLTERVNAGVGAAAATHRAVLDAHRVDGAFEHALYGRKRRTDRRRA